MRPTDYANFQMQHRRTHSSVQVQLKKLRPEAEGSRRKGGSKEKGTVDLGTFILSRRAIASAWTLERTRALRHPEIGPGQKHSILLDMDEWFVVWQISVTDGWQTSTR